MLRAFRSAIDGERIAAAIRAAEAGTTAEIRVHVTSHRPHLVQQAAEACFERLGMTQTKDRNGVLLYVAPRARRFAVVGDVGIHERAGDRLWRPIAFEVEWQFRNGRFTEGIVDAVTRAGAALAEHFPARPGEPNPNELPDSPSGD